MKTKRAISFEDDEFKGDERWGLVQRVIASKPFENSARLRDFLLYVTTCSLRNMPEEATEQHIGIHVFGRRPGFNSNEDSIVRSQARLLRIKLASYYKSPEGQLEATAIQIPKGHYLPAFLPNSSASAHDVVIHPEVDPVSGLPEALHPTAGETPVSFQGAAAAVPPPDGGSDGVWAAVPASTHKDRLVGRGLLPWGWLVLAIGVVAVAVIGFFFGRRVTTPSVNEDVVYRLWKPFLSGEKPLVIYSNASFVGDSRTGMHSISSEASSPTTIDTYTGVGELSAIRDITKMFDSHHADFVLKRSKLVTWDEAKEHNLIFIGSTAENPSLHAMPQKGDFDLVAEPDQAGFINRHPKPGESTRYMRPERPLTLDYAVIEYHPSIGSNLHILVFSGLTTLGTQAAVEFAISPEGAAQLSSAAFRRGQLQSFDALLEVSINGGVPIQSRLISIHTQ